MESTESSGIVGVSVDALSAARALRQRRGIGVIGYGRVARRWQLPSYVQAGLNVVAICDTDPTALEHARRSYPSVRLYASVAELLADSDVMLVDVATRPPGRLDLIRRIVATGRDVLAQKPLAVDASGLDDIMAVASSTGATVAVNQNGRFAPGWRATTELLRSGRIGRVRAITHVYDTNLRWMPNPDLQGTTQFLLFDYSNHWIDICGHWLDPDPVIAVQAMEYDVAPDSSGLVQQSMWVSFETVSGANALIRGAAAGTSHAGHRFVVQGDLGTIRGDVDSPDGEYLELDDGKGATRLSIQGSWFPDGFLASMVHLLRSIEDGREPEHSLANNRRTLELVSAACRSARLRGARIELTPLQKNTTA